MMELYIRLQNGEPFEHPIFGDNFRQAFPDVDINNLPAEFARFERIEAPLCGEYEKPVLTYGWVDGMVKDIWSVVEMTAEEKAEVDRIKAELLSERVRLMNESGMGVTRV
jgi:L-rhamnose isomerase